MKIIITDNFERPEVSDRLFCNDVPEDLGETLVEVLNERERHLHHSIITEDYFALVPDDYKLEESGI